MNEVRQILMAHAGQSLLDERNVLHITLGNALDSSLDTPRRFNELSAAERIRVARSALAQAGAINVVEAPVGLLNLVEGAPARAMDAKPRCSHDGLFGHICGPSGITEGPDKISAEDAAVFRGLLKRLKARKRRPEQDRRDNQVASDSEALADAAAQTVRNGAEGFRSGDLADAETELQPIPEQLADLTEERLRNGDLTGAFSDPYALGLASSDLERKREIEEYRADVAAQKRIVARESSPHDLAPPPSAAIKSPLRRPDLQDQPRRLPVDGEDVEHERKMRERRANIEALARQVRREGGPRPISHGLAGNPPQAAYDRAPVSDLEYFRGAAAATCGGRL
jgi:hypothetical protein